MKQKTQVRAEKGQQELFITREFDLPVELVYQAYSEAELLEQWMGTKVVELEMHRHGSYQFETSDPMGNTHRFHGTIHDVTQNLRITRTFEMEGAQVGVQLEFLEFESLSDETSCLRIHIVYSSATDRDKMLSFGMGPGMNMAHNRLEQVAGARR